MTAGHTASSEGVLARQSWRIFATAEDRKHPLKPARPQGAPIWQEPREDHVICENALKPRFFKWTEQRKEVPPGIVY
jgi:hypothetical protein